MEPKFTKEDSDQASKLLHFYTDLIENNELSLKYYLASNVVLDWFGKTIKDETNVLWFLRNNVINHKVTHDFSIVKPSRQIAFKDVHNVKVKSASRSDRDLFTSLPTPPPPQKLLETPPPASTSTLEIGQGDGLHNDNSSSPHKKIRLCTEGEEIGETVEDEEPIQLQYVTGEGEVEFHRPSTKRLQQETKWRRKTKLHIGYTCNNFEDCTIYLIIYEGNVKCRRNLLKEFDGETE